ncbi:hypothetical protein ACQKML_23990 [Peribacillus frigoritolerans]
MCVNDRIYIKNPYLDYLMFSHWKELRGFFEEIPSWVNTSRNDQQEAKFLLTEMVSDIFDIKFTVSFGYRLEVVEKIKSKLGYSIIEKTIKADIMRLYNETQKKLKHDFKTNSLLLYRGLNSPELLHFYENPTQLKTNTLSSFTTDVNFYGHLEVQVSIEVPIENVLFYENLCPLRELINGGFGRTLGLYVEREVIVFNKNEYFNIKEVTHTNMDS